MRTAIPRWALLMGALALASIASTAVAAVDATPQITECRIGFDGTFKVGHWTPIWVAVTPNAAAAKLTVVVTTPDSDGVPVTSSATAEPSGPTLLYARVGRLGNSVQVKLLGDSGRILDRRELSAQHSQEGSPSYSALPATGQLMLHLGSGSLELDELLRSDQEARDGAATSAAVQIVDVDSLPIDWFGYDAVDVLVLTTNDVEFCQRLAADSRRFDALRSWLELGGRLVVCGGRNAPKLFAAGMPLAGLLPGRFTDLVRLPQTQSLETFAGSGDAISSSGAQQNIPLPRLVDVEGRVDLFGRGNELPIVVRAPRGMGELVFVGVDLTEPPFAEWTGRRAFLRAVLRPYLGEADATSTRQKLVTLGYDDLAGALRQRLGRSFTGVAVIGFPVVSLLIIGYLMLLGPLDYLFVDRITRRPGLAWLTLPTIVVATALGAFFLAGVAKDTERPQINQLELVDFDLTTGRTRGLGWATLYSALAERFDLSLAPRTPAGKPLPAAQSLVSWSGLPGNGLGGMHAAGEPIDVTGVGYSAGDNWSKLTGVPVLTSSTKSLVALWDASSSASGTPPLAAELTVDDDGLLVGTLTNQSGASLHEAYLMHGQWGFRLGDLAPGLQVEINSRMRPLPVKSIVTRRSRRSAAAGSEQETFLADRASAEELLHLMMFYEAAGGEGYAGLRNRYQAECDLSRLLDFDRAILIASGTGRGSPWIDTATGEAFTSKPDAPTAVYRFILPINNRQAATAN